jgi:hypothetical protein
MPIRLRNSGVTGLATRAFVSIALGLGSLAAFGDRAFAGWTSNATGSVDVVIQYAPDALSGQSVLFHLVNMPTTGCTYNDYFAISSASITDPQVLKNFLATLLAAKLTGATVAVGFDSGTSCDPSGRPRIFALQLLP